jgi:hypothetical protein
MKALQECDRLRAINSELVAALTEIAAKAQILSGFDSQLRARILHIGQRANAAVERAKVKP